LRRSCAIQLGFLLALLAPALLAAGAPRALAEPRYGDSTWVAPEEPPSGDPTQPGPRVAEPDHERRWETVLRAPFRAVFYPVRIVARGMEAAMGIAEDVVPPGARRTGPRTGMRITPAFSYSGAGGPGAGASLTWRGGEGTVLGASGTWSLHDNRRLRLRAEIGEGTSAIGMGLEGLHDYRPNRRFYGMGNDAPDERTIYLRRENRLEASIFAGRTREQRLRLLAGLSDISIGGGYNAAGSRLAEDAFSEAEVPFLRRGSRAVYVGAAGDFARLDQVRDPSRGFHLRGEERRMHGTGPFDLDYDAWRLEGRGYLPVGASRRVLALRGVLRGVDPKSGSDPIPFYRLAESSDLDRFAAYENGRFRDRRLLFLRAEYRWLIWERLWAVALAERGEVAPSNGGLRWAGMHESYGGGLRLRISDTHTARVEIAKGADGMNFYVDLKGDF
jgi:hypothetical protein